MKTITILHGIYGPASYICTLNLKHLTNMPLISLLISALLLAAPQASSSKRTLAGARSELTALSSTFTVDNQTSVAVGIVTVHFLILPDEHITVTGGGGFGVSIDAAPIACIVNGQILPQNTPTWITIDEHTSVRMTWTSSVIVVDQALTR